LQGGKEAIACRTDAVAALAGLDDVGKQRGVAADFY
jgi:hypothetical protein